MNFIDLVRRESDMKVLRPLLIAALIAGACNAAVLVIMNDASTATYDSSDPTKTATVDTQLFFMYILVIVTLITAKRFAILNTSRMIEDIMNRMRLRMLNKVRFSELSTVEKMEQGTLYNRITQQTQTISQNAPMTMDMLQGGIMLFFTMFYVMYLSLTAFGIIVASSVIAYFLYERRRLALEELVTAANKQELEIYDSLDYVLSGFKEIKLNQNKSNAVFGKYRTVAEGLKDLRTKIALLFAENVIYARIFFYVLTGVVLFGLPMVIGAYSENITKITAAVLFFMGPLLGLVGAIPAIINTNAAIENIYTMEENLDTHMEPELLKQISDYDAVQDIEYPKLPFAKEIVFRNILFSYRTKKGDAFTLGPIEEFRIKQGEMLFIEGGNGSGKSTLLKILTGLYFPNPGSTITVDGYPVTKDNFQNYRELFAAVFTDFHLSQKLYGLKQIDPKKVEELLNLMQVYEKTKIENDMFTDIDLSTGQRKRLALIVTYLEDKDIYAFDEVAADQDPQFREYFYTTLLPELKRNGKTVIVITHDDRYFSCAERKIKMEYGRVFSEEFYDDGKVRTA